MWVVKTEISENDKLPPIWKWPKKNHTHADLINLCRLRLREKNWRTLAKHQQRQQKKTWERKKKNHRAITRVNPNSRTDVI